MERLIRRKLNSKEGFTLVEMLCCCLILVMLTLVVNAGLDIAGKSYGRMVAENEAQVLLSSASIVLSDELRYAAEDSGGVTLLKASGDAARFVFGSDTYWGNGKKTAMYINSDGHLAAREESGGALIGDEYRMLPKSDYGRPSIPGAVYTIESIAITKTGDMFKYTITVKRGTGPNASIEGIVKNMKNAP